MAATTRELFSTRFEVQSADEKRNTFSGLASVFGSLILPQPPSMMPTMFLKGAWIKTLRENGAKIKVYRGHEALIGKMVSGSETEDGLLFTGRISETRDGNDTLALMRDGALNELSVAWVPLQVELLKGRDLLEKLGGWNVNGEVAERIRARVGEYGEAERYRVVRQARLYHVGVVDEGADPETSITEVNEQISTGTAQPGETSTTAINTGGKDNEAMNSTAAELFAPLTVDMIRDHARDLSISLVQALTPLDAAQGEEPAPVWIDTVQALYLCSAITALLQMPAAMTEQMSKAPSPQTEKHEGRMFSSKNLQMLKDLRDICDRMIKAAEGPQEEDESVRPASTVEPQSVPPNVDCTPVVRNINPRQVLRDAVLAHARLTQEMITHEDETGTCPGTR